MNPKLILTLAIYIVFPLYSQERVIISEEAKFKEELQTVRWLGDFLGEWKIYNFIKHPESDRQDFLGGDPKEWIGKRLVIDYQSIRFIDELPKVYYKFHDKTECKFEESLPLISNSDYSFFHVRKLEELGFNEKISGFLKMNNLCDETPFISLRLVGENLIFKFTEVLYLMRRIDSLQKSGNTLFIGKYKSWKKVSSYLKSYGSYNSYYTIFLENEYWVFAGTYKNVFDSDYACSYLYFRGSAIPCKSVVIYPPEEPGQPIIIKEAKKDVYWNLAPKVPKTD